VISAKYGIDGQWHSLILSAAFSLHVCVPTHSRQRG
jgi:hypothetical protein